MNKLIQIHSFAGVDIITDPNTEGGEEAGKPKMNRNQMVKEIKAQLDQYLRHSNANFDIDQIDYQFDTKATDGKEGVGELSARKTAIMDVEI